jgi:hypothetical protein
MIWFKKHSLSAGLFLRWNVIGASGSDRLRQTSYPKKYSINFFQGKDNEGPLKKVINCQNYSCTKNIGLQAFQ